MDYESQRRRRLRGLFDMKISVPLLDLLAHIFLTVPIPLRSHTHDYEYVTFCELLNFSAIFRGLWAEPF